MKRKAPISIGKHLRIQELSNPQISATSGDSDFDESSDSETEKESSGQYRETSEESGCEEPNRNMIDAVNQLSLLVVIISKNALMLIHHWLSINV